MRSADSDKLACITVTYYPDPAVLRTQFLALPAGALKLLVDNGTPDALWAEALRAVHDIAKVVVIRMGANVGLAAAINAGGRYARSKSASRWLLMLDQDSEPASGAIDALLTAYRKLEKDGVPVGAVGPVLFDPCTERRYGFHRVRGWIWGRVNPAYGPPLRCDGLNGSGTLIELALLERLGGLDEALFIDHVDTEWSFRIQADGLQLFGVPAATFIHRMGERSVRLWFGGWRVWPVRSPLRHRYLFRNAVALLRRPYVPRVWKAWVLPKLVLSAIIFAITGPERRAQLRAMGQGVLDGVRGRVGAL